MDYNNILSSLGNLGNLDPNLFATLTSNVSTSLQGILDRFNNHPLLSALNSLSGAPLHPYDQLKFNVYGPEFKDIEFKTLDDIPAPQNFKPEEVIVSVTNTIHNMQRTLLENTDKPPHLFTNTMLNTVSGETIVPNIEAHKKHIEFTELIRQIPVARLTDEQVYDYANKIISEFIKTY